MQTGSLIGVLCSAALAVAGPATAAVTVNSTDAIYNYGGTSVGGASSTTPPELSVAALAGQYITFAATGAVSLTPGGYPFGPHGPDGGPTGVFTMNVAQAAGISGVYSLNVGYLAGVFLNGLEAATTPLPNSDLTGQNFTSLSPLIDQVFFIGDGLTGTGSGSVQRFFVPIGATRLVLGIVDAHGYNGVPGAYFDNSGSYDVAVALPGGVPEPATWAMMILGFGAAGSVIRRRKAVVA